MRTVLLCPFAAGTVLWQTQSGGWTLTVCVRGTFTFTPGREAALADVAEPVTGDRHDGDDPRAGLFVASDLVPYKPRADVMLVGSAYAPDGEPVDALVARLTLGELDKAVGVVGDRVWIDGPDGPEPSLPALFTSMPLRYERAARAPENPIGFDLTRPPVAGAPALPNLEAADDDVATLRTVGFGPVLPSAATRRALLHPDGWAWFEGGGRGPLPAGFDFAFFNAAPRDQQIDVIRPGTSVVLENLHRRYARFETRLPSVRPKAFLLPANPANAVDVAMRCDTIWIDTDRALLTLSWRGYLSVPAPDEDAIGMLIVAAETKGHEVGLQHLARLLDPSLASATTDGDTFADTHRALPSRAAAEAPRSLPIPVASKAPIVTEAEETMPASYDELPSSEFHLETTGVDEPKTLERIDTRRLHDAITDEPSTRPAMERPPAVSSLDLGVADFARIAVAVERGDAGRVLFGYRLTLGDLPRLQRTWSERCAADPSFAALFAAEVADARRG